MYYCITIQLLDHQISKYAEALYQRVGGTLYTSHHDSIIVSNQDLYNRCYRRALHKLTKGQSK